ncbi:P27 family phage terminase small subunit [Lactococcus carnosus]|uniref:P27 family phage terminase small subunit n=1 Tax=Pseudolactococcus carnosus TaxID=2749961 RepID=A0ABT0AS18_9LACT|nr:P27 family phage terminase small subunit [Lactococcus carnosus]MCJ1989407.1 P27 family phage terminase small subunit [Lactococcus carnosus]
MVKKNIPQVDTIKRRTISYMKELGTYKKQYNQLIEVYSDLLYQYYILTKQFEETGYEVVIETEKSGGKKSPILATLENLRKDIGTYSDRLLLNAKSNKDSEINIKTNADDPFNNLFDNLKSG